MKVFIKLKTISIFLLLNIFIFNSTFFIEAYDNNIQFKDITIKDGLSQSTVEAIYQDSSGYMWIGTHDGLNRYDGYNFKIYKQGDNTSTSIAGNHILSITEDKDNHIWIATANGISKIDTKKDSVRNYFNENKNGDLLNYNTYDILITRDDKILVATGDGLKLYNEKTDSFQRILSKNEVIYLKIILSMIIM